MVMCLFQNKFKAIHFRFGQMRSDQPNHKGTEIYSLYLCMCGEIMEKFSWIFGF